jgi:hypothetical protein
MHCTLTMSTVGVYYNTLIKTQMNAKYTDFDVCLPVILLEVCIHVDVPFRVPLLLLEYVHRVQGLLHLTNQL